MKQTTVNATLMAGTIALGIFTASLQGFSSMQFVGAAAVPVLFGLAVAGIRKLFRRGPTNVFKWMFGWAVVAAIIEVLHRITN